MIGPTMAERRSFASFYIISLFSKCAVRYQFPADSLTVDLRHLLYSEFNSFLKILLTSIFSERSRLALGAYESTLKYNTIWKPTCYPYLQATLKKNNHETKLIKS